MSHSPSYDYRAERGRLICDKGTEVSRLDDNEYAVRSQSGVGQYQVRATELGWTCSCPDYSYRQSKCKHIHAVEFSRKIRTAVELGTLAEFTTTDALCVLRFKARNQGRCSPQQGGRPSEVHLP
ncbi:MAG: SWIM zinc finger family protein [Thaumarchaeota archaeon]|nr:SWIM zinc finger family protein [Nitrososphaerota archaeon]